MCTSFCSARFSVQVRRLARSVTPRDDMLVDCAVFLNVLAKIFGMAEIRGNLALPVSESASMGLLASDGKGLASGRVGCRLDENNLIALGDSDSV